MADETVQPAVPEGLLKVEDTASSDYAGPSDQSESMDAATSALKGIGAVAQSDIGDAKAGEVTYGGTDANVLKEDAAIDKGSSYISPNETVAGQLNQLMDADNDYIRIQERRAKEEAADLGLLGSSAAVGATRRAAIESALPIAQQDAQTFATAALNEQQTYNEVSSMKAESDLSASAREHIYDIDTAKTKFNGQLQSIMDTASAAGNYTLETSLTELKSTWDAEVSLSLKELEGKLSRQVQNDEITAREKEWASTNSTQVMAAAYGSISELMGNADFMAGFEDDEESTASEKMSAIFNNYINFAKDQVSFIGSSASLAPDYMGDPTDTSNPGWLDLIGSYGAPVWG